MTQWGLDTLFNPAKRHMDEEKRRLQSTREQIGDSSGGRRIDLESGKVTIRAAGEGTAGDRTADDSVDGAPSERVDGDRVDSDGDQSRSITASVEERDEPGESPQTDAENRDAQ